MSTKKHTVRIDWKKHIMLACVFAFFIHQYGEKPAPVNKAPKILHITEK
ncbi:hypothetical protein KASHIRA_02070 [Serratia phage vB_SmaM-Kashira]|nr:hypothetical protein KASHIRA_02070 [Serratia phage vB_SmaM-Kashira]